MLGSYLRIRYATPIYNVVGKLLVKEDNPYGNNAEKFGNIFALPSGDNNLNNEIEIIKSRSMAARVAKSLGLQRQYAIKGNIRTSTAPAADIPFTWIITQLADSTHGFGFNVKIVSASQFQLNEDPKMYNFNELVNVNGVQFQLVASPVKMKLPDPNEYIIGYAPLQDVAAGLSGGLNAVKAEQASVIYLTFPTENTKIGLDVVNQYMKEYLQSSLEDKKVIAFNTLDFIDTQLDTLKKRIGWR